MTIVHRGDVSKSRDDRQQHPRRKSHFVALGILLCWSYYATVASQAESLLVASLFVIAVMITVGAGVVLEHWWKRREFGVRSHLGWLAWSVTLLLSWPLSMTFHGFWSGSETGSWLATAAVLATAAGIGWLGAASRHGRGPQRSPGDSLDVQFLTSSSLVSRWSSIFSRHPAEERQKNVAMRADTTDRGDESTPGPQGEYAQVLLALAGHSVLVGLTFHLVNLVLTQRAVPFVAAGLAAVLFAVLLEHRWTSPTPSARPSLKAALAYDQIVMMVAPLAIVVAAAIDSATGGTQAVLVAAPLVLLWWVFFASNVGTWRLMVGLQHGSADHVTKLLTMHMSRRSALARLWAVVAPA